MISDSLKSSFWKDTAGPSHSVCFYEPQSTITGLSESCPRKQSSVYILRTMGKQKTSQEKLLEGRTEPILVGLQMQTGESSLLLNGKSRKPFSQQAAQILEKKKTQAN